jgi:hypothetical protein
MLLIDCYDDFPVRKLRFATLFAASSTLPPRDNPGFSP